MSYLRVRLSCVDVIYREWRKPQKSSVTIIQYTSEHKLSGTMEFLLNSQEPKGDMKQTLYWGPVNISRQGPKFRSPGHKAPEFCVPLMYFLLWDFNWRFSECEAKLLTITSLYSMIYGFENSFLKLNFLSEETFARIPKLQTPQRRRHFA
jgi:hypothetical protein